MWGPAELASNSRAAYDGRNFLVVWDDERGAVSGVAAARVTADGVSPGYAERSHTVGGGREACSCRRVRRDELPRRLAGKRHERRDQ